MVNFGLDVAKLVIIIRTAKLYAVFSDHLHTYVESVILKS